MPNRGICGCPVTQQDNIRLPRYLTGQDRSHSVAQPGSSERLSRCVTGEQLSLYCCVTSASKLSYTVSQCHLQETSHLGIPRLLQCQYKSTSHSFWRSRPPLRRPTRLRNRPSRYVTEQPVTSPGDGWASVRNIYIESKVGHAHKIEVVQRLSSKSVRQIKNRVPLYIIILILHLSVRPSVRACVRAGGHGKPFDPY